MTNKTQTPRTREEKCAVFGEAFNRANSRIDNLYEDFDAGNGNLVGAAQSAGVPVHLVDGLVSSRIQYGINALESALQVENHDLSAILPSCGELIDDIIQHQIFKIRFEA